MKIIKIGLAIISFVIGLLLGGLMTLVGLAGVMNVIHLQSAGVNLVLGLIILFVLCGITPYLLIGLRSTDVIKQIKNVKAKDDNHKNMRDEYETDEEEAFI